MKKVIWNKIGDNIYIYRREKNINYDYFTRFTIVKRVDMDKPSGFKYTVNDDTVERKFDKLKAAKKYIEHRYQLWVLSKL